jgi:hypothetical protein
VLSCKMSSNFRIGFLTLRCPLWVDAVDKVGGRIGLVAARLS